MSLTATLIIVAFLVGATVLSCAASRLQDRETRYDRHHALRQGWRDLGMALWITAGLGLVFPFILLILLAMLPFSWLVWP